VIRLSRLVVVTLIALAVPARQTAACECAGGSFCGADDAAALFVGKVLAVWTTPTRVVAQFRVERAAKGVSPGQIVAIASAPGGSAACGLDFHVGRKRWLISAHYSETPSAARPIGGRQTPLGSGFCEGSHSLADGDPGPLFPSRSDVGGTVVRYGGPASIGGGLPPVAGVRVWVQTPDGIRQTKTDEGGRFLLRDVPLRPPRRLRVDVGPGDVVRPVTLAPWTPEVCGLRDVLVEPRRPTPAPRGR
jgi:hypothetical protein